MNIFNFPPSSLSVVVVSDYEASEEKTWKDERHILYALAAQDIGKPFPVILVENTSVQDSVPPELYKIVPQLKIIFADESQSARLKNEGVKHAHTAYVAVLEADCLPNQEWLRVLEEALLTHPDFSIAGGRTMYGDETMYKRCLTVLDRSFDNLGRAGQTPHVSNNGALYKSSVLKEFPYPQAATPFLSSRLRIKTMENHGHKFYFEPRAVMRHAIGGWDFIRDFRRNTGYADMMEHTRRESSQILKLLGRRFKREYADCFRLGPKYLRWYDWPLLILLLGVVSFLEIPGMLDALRGGKSIPQSAYR